MSISSETMYSVRLDATRDAVKRTRFAMLVSTVVSLSFLFATWNSYMSWDKKFTLAEDDEVYSAQFRAAVAKAEHEAAKKLLLEIQSSPTASISSPDAKKKNKTNTNIDLASINYQKTKNDLDVATKNADKKLNDFNAVHKKTPIKQSISAPDNFIYKRFAKDDITQHAQREFVSEWVRNNTISFGLLGIRISQNDAAPLAAIALFIINFWVLYSVRRQNHIVGSLLIDSVKEEFVAMQTIYHGVVSYMLFLDVTGKDSPVRHLNEGSNQNTSIPLLRSVLIILAFLPVLVLSFIVYVDIVSMEELSPIRFQGETLERSISASLKGIAMSWDGLSIVLTIVIFFFIYFVLDFERSTLSVIREYADLLEKKKLAAQTNTTSSTLMSNK